MRTLAILAASASSVSGCGAPEQAPRPVDREAGESTAQPAVARPPARPASGWALQATDEGTLLALRQGAGAPALRLFCPVARSELLVNVPAFRPIDSEERLSFGSGGNAVALVADTGGDPQRGGVSATGLVPRNLAALIDGAPSASYGTQVSGPHPPPPANLAQRFASACYKRLSVPPAAPPGEPPAATVPLGACMMQGDDALRVAPLRAVGTEPFWAARIEGRCVTYSHPDELGIRIWTRYAPAPGGGGTWSGALAGEPFQLRTRPQAGCSDGMSDRRFPIAVELQIGSERRRGCAEPA